MSEDDELMRKLKENQIMLGHICADMRMLNEKIETILYTVSKSNDEKTKENISKYLISNFRNRTH